MRNLQSQSFTKKKRIKFWSKVIITLTSIGVVVAVMSWVMQLGFINIRDVQVFGADQDISEQIHSLVMGELNGKYMGVFPKSNIFIYPKEDISTNIKKQFVRVLDVSINHEGLSGIRVTVNEKIPKAVVCVTLPSFNGDILVFDSNDPCYFADEDGLLFERIPVITGHPYNIYYAPDISSVSMNNSSSSNDFMGAYATSTVEFRKLQSFYDGIVHNGLQGDAILLKDDGEFELYSSSTIIYFNESEGIEDELANLNAFWSHSVNNDRVNKTSTIFDYIDLRYAPNVFYKIVR